MFCKVIARCIENFGISLSIQSSSRNVRSVSTDISTISFSPDRVLSLSKLFSAITFQNCPCWPVVIPSASCCYLAKIFYFHSSLTCSLQIQRKMCPLSFPSSVFPCASDTTHSLPSFPKHHLSIFSFMGPFQLPTLSCLSESNLMSSLLSPVTKTAWSWCFQILPTIT